MYCSIERTEMEAHTASIFMQGMDCSGSGDCKSSALMTGLDYIMDATSF